MTIYNKQTMYVVTVLLLIVSASSCRQQSNVDVPAQTSMAEHKEAPLYNQVPVADTVVAPAPAGSEQQPAPQVPAPHFDWDKKIIKNAEITVEVKDYKKFNAAVHASVKQFGAYIAQEEQNESDYKIENILTIKIPVDQFENAVNALVFDKEKILAKKITSQDVTGEVVDTRSRMEAKRQARLRYLDLLKQAKNMEEILQVQKEINDIQVEIESAAGKVNYLTHAAAFSTIQLTFFQVLNAQAEYPERPGFGQRVLNALKSGLEWMGEMFVVILTLWPLWLALGAAWWGFRKWKAAKPKAG